MRGHGGGPLLAARRLRLKKGGALVGYVGFKHRKGSNQTYINRFKLWKILCGLTLVFHA